MNSIVRVSLSAVLILGSPVLPAQRSAEAASACYRSADHASALDCLTKYVATSSALVEKAERKALETLAKNSESPADLSRAIEALNASARQYQLYRRTQCEFVALLAFGGNGESDRRLLCQIDLDDRRVADLAREQSSEP
jgi:uncharacterized protein YecT (DUF1311 family)